MPSSNEAIAYSLAASQKLLQRYTADFTAEDYLHRISPKANCAAWTIGHLVLSDRNALAAMGVSDLPPLPDGFDKRFARNETCAAATEFGDVSTLMPLFNQMRARLIEAVGRATPAQLDQPRDPPHPMFKTTGELANFMAIHTAMHAGQITFIRRSLGRPPLV